MDRIVFGRKKYWLQIAGLVAMKIGIWFVLEHGLMPRDIVRTVDTVVTFGFALSVGGRLADLGGPNWLRMISFAIGIVAVFAVVLVLPMMLFVQASGSTSGSQNSLDISLALWVSLATLAVSVIGAGIPKSRPLNMVSHDPSVSSAA